ncbi:MAG: HDIG domain-containing protein [Deltaproteobacteria bacterium]|nr:MAG: HDIG domain-containing protein [Deltaproteobacteria bacterium]
MKPSEPRYARPPSDASTRWLVAVLVAAVAAVAAVVHRRPMGLAATARVVAGSGIVGLLAGRTWAEFVIRWGHRMRWRRDVLTVASWVCVPAGAVILAGARVPAFATAALFSAACVPLARHAGSPATVGACVVYGLAVAVLGRPVLAVAVLAYGTALAIAPGPPWRSAFRWAPRTLGAAVLAADLAALGAAATFDVPRAPVPWYDHDLAATALAIPLGAFAGFGCVPLFERLSGHAIRSQLFDLADLRHPLLERIATRAPGTWQHSRAMANLAEQAANAIGADALLVRVGAYYHDLGKAEAPRFFVENLGPGEPNPHDALPPAESAARIVDHVREGVRQGRAAKLPEDIVDFMHTHHGDGLVEYFWQKARREGGAVPPDPADFRYPGARPFSKETAILAIVDAVEAAARTLERPTERDVERLVRQIVFSKLLAGQLDDADLSPADLRVVAQTLVASLLAAAHERVRYPWQQGGEDDGPSLAADASDGHVPPAADESSIQLRIVDSRGDGV